MFILLEICRGLAALWVFLFHIRSHFENSSSFLYELSKNGDWGVPIFFVISGYVITLSAESHLRRNSSPFVFLKKRALRIYPTFWVSVILVLIFPYVIELISSLKSGSYNWPTHQLDVFTNIEWVNFLLLSKVFFANSHDLQSQFNVINAVYWTLAIEMQFYIFMFFTMFLKSWFKLMLGLVTLISLVNLFNPFDINYGLFIHYWPSFAVGILLSYTFKHYKSSTVNVAALIVFSVTLYSYIEMSHLSNLFSSFYVALLFGALLVLISPLESKLSNTDNLMLKMLLKPFVILGSMSYSVYLLHGQLYLIPEMFVRQVISNDNVIYGLLIILFTLMLCYPVYFFVERKFMSSPKPIVH